MDSLLELLNKNKEWLFSGVGVVALSFIGKLLWDRLHPPSVVSTSPTVPAPQAAISPEPNAIPAPTTDYTKVEMERAFFTKRVHVGDYIDISRDTNRKIRITVKGLSELDIPIGILNQAEREDVVAITVDLGGAIAYCGSNVKKTAVNEFLVPQLKGDEPLRSVFSFINSKEYSSLIRIAVEHINRPMGIVDITVVHLVGLFRLGALCLNVEAV